MENINGSVEHYAVGADMQIFEVDLAGAMNLPERSIILVSLYAELKLKLKTLDFNLSEVEHVHCAHKDTSGDTCSNLDVTDLHVEGGVFVARYDFDLFLFYLELFKAHSAHSHIIEEASGSIPINGKVFIGSDEVRDDSREIVSEGLKGANIEVSLNSTWVLYYGGSLCGEG